jgi:hypothetical protein
MSFGPGFGHACLTTEGDFTARHVAYREMPPMPLGLRWSSADGSVSGWAAPVNLSNFEDLALLALSVSPPYRATQIASGPPSVGDRVWWIEYNWTKKGKAFARKVRFAKVSRIFAGMILFDDVVHSGASGGCLVNDQNEVVGVVFMGQTAEDKKQSGGAIAIWAPWLDRVKAPTP